MAKQIREALDKVARFEIEGYPPGDREALLDELYAICDQHIADLRELHASALRRLG